MATKRPDLDGKRLVIPGRPEVWVVFGGEVHYIESPEAYQNLFKDTDELQRVAEVGSIALGSPIVSTAMLARAEGQGAIFLVNGSPPIRIVKHYICSVATFRDFHFADDKVKAVPDIVLQALRSGIELQSAKDRAQPDRLGDTTLDEQVSSQAPESRRPLRPPNYLRRIAKTIVHNGL